MKHVFLKTQTWIFLAILIASAASCMPKPSSVTSNSGNQDASQVELTSTDTSTDTSVETTSTSNLFLDPVLSKIKPRPPSVSRFRIDDPTFMVMNLSVGLQSFMESESPVLMFKIPREADYVEIARCSSNAIINSGMTPVSLEDVDLSGASDGTKNGIYRTDDFFTAATTTNGCSLLTDSNVEATYLDAWAGSGSYRYLVRACVAPQRLTDTDALTSRNCSLQVGISSVLKDYVNQRSDLMNKALQNAAAQHTKMESLDRLMVYNAYDDAKSIQECEEREHDRNVAKNFKNAVAGIVNAGIDIFIEMNITRQFVEVKAADGTVAHATYGELMSYYGPLAKNSAFAEASTFQRMMDRSMFMSAWGGTYTAAIVQNLVQTSDDMTRQCGNQLQTEYATMPGLMDQFTLAAIYYYYYMSQVECYKNLTTVIAGGDANGADQGTCGGVADPNDPAGTTTAPAVGQEGTATTNATTKH